MANPKKIFIFNPNDKPFGPLSNLYKFTDEFVVNDQKFRNILNYVYNFCGCTALERQILARMTNQFEIHETALKMNRDCYTTFTLNALETAYTHLFKKSDLRQRLLNTGNRNLIYLSRNPIEGMGPNQNGLNRVGQMLMKLRSQYQKEEINKKPAEESEKYKDYLKYITYRFLYELIIKGQNNLKEFENMNTEQIIDKVGKPAILENAISFDIFSDLYKFRDPEEIIQIKLYPNKLSQILRKKYIEEYRNKLLYDNSLDLTDMYIRYKKIYQGQIVNQEDALKLIKFQPSKYNDLIDRILNLYLQNKLSSKLSDDFNKKFNIPSLDEIENIKNYVFSEGQDEEVEELILDEVEEDINIEKEEVELISKKDEQGNIYFGAGNDGKFDFLDPQYIHLMSIDGLYYPSVYHYKVAISISLAMLYTDEKIDISQTYYKKFIPEGHINLLKNPNLNPLDFNSYELNFETLTKLNDTVQEQMFYREIRNRLERAYQIKFNNPELRQLLVNTGDNDLIYSDPNDPILGESTVEMSREQRVNTNISGQILMKMRNTFIAEGMVITQIQDKGIRLDELVGQNKEFMDWVYMRLDDIIESVKLTIEYLRKNEYVSQNILLKPDLIYFIINNIYANCKDLLISFDKLSNTPLNVYKYISRRLKQYGIGPTGITVIWYYVYSLITQAIEHLGKGDPNKTIQILQSIPEQLKDSLSCEGFYDNQVQNCTLVVIKKLLSKMKNYIQTKYKQYKISENDIDYIINMLIKIDKIPQKNDREIFTINLSIKSEPYTLEQKQKIEFIISKMDKLKDKNFIKQVLQLTEDVQDQYLSNLINIYEEDDSQENLKEIKDYLNQLLDYRKEQDFVRSQQVKYIITMFEEYFSDPNLDIEERNNILRKIIWFLNYVGQYTRNTENKKKLVSRLNLFLNSKLPELKPGLLRDALGI